MPSTRQILKSESPEPCHGGTWQTGIKDDSTAFTDAGPANYTSQDAVLCQTSRNARWDM